jgi:hypothetical protein
MKRHFLLAALVGLASLSARAEAPATPSDRDSRLSMPTTSAPDIQFATSAAAENGQDSTGALNAVYSAFSLEDLPPAENTENAESAAAAVGAEGRPLHPVCDCGCSIGSLDHWCVYDLHCGTSEGCAGHPCEAAVGGCYLTEDGCWVSDDACCDVWGRPVYGPNTAVRFGWWGVGTDDSLNKTGEFQDLSSSPFWDVDSISSDGVRTWDVAFSGLDNEANDARVYYYSPGWSAKVDFQRYLRRWDHDPLAGYDRNNPVPPGPNDNVISEDLNVGEDYAIRVQELDTSFQGRMSDSLKWRLNVWSQRKFGERQSNATAHCFNINAPAPAGANGNVCHVLSQRQTIDWVTVEVEPVIEARFENVTVEYSRKMRGFGQDDGSIDRQYTRFGFSPASGALGPDYDYAIVPESFTQIDRLKVGARLTEYNQLYANLYYGDTKNHFRDIHRTYNGYDIRLINSSYDDVKLTGYTSRYEEDTDFPPFFLNEPPLAPASTYDQDSLRHPLEYTRTRAGLKGSWQPFGDRGPRCSNYGLWDGTSLASGYEYYLLERDFATYDTLLGPFTQPDTKTHQIEFGPSTRWSRSLDTYVRYKVRFIDDPLIGVREANGRFNSNQPEEVHATEIGGTWTPTNNFMTTAQFSFINSWHDSEFANFDEDNYPMVFTMWYAPTHRLSLTSGYAYYSNWIDQDITLGFTTPGAPVPPVRTETTRWNYEGENHLVSFGANYAWSECVQLVAGYEWNRGTNTFDVPASPAGADWSLLPFLADVIVETNRVTAGVDWQPYCDTNVYLRYIYFDYDDLSAGLYSGTAHMALGGVTRTW